MSERFEDAMKALLHHGGALNVTRGGQPLPVRVVGLSASGDRRPDGLRDDAPTDLGFSFEVAFAALEVDTATLDAAAIAAVHDVLTMAGYDDWMDYTHLGRPPTGVLGVQFSSQWKGARLLSDVLAALGVSEDDVAVG